MAEYTLGAKALIGDVNLSVLHDPYDLPVDVSDGAFESDGCTEPRVFGRLADLRVSAESIVEPMCSTLGSMSDRRHSSSELRATTAVLALNKLSVAQVEPLLQGAQLYRSRKLMYSRVLDRIISTDLRKEIAAVPWPAIKRVARSESSHEEDELSSETGSSESPESESKTD
ncbi:hypothetical protein FOL47_000611 [Perkinsus chesapeaki]|uniref:Uncharacterized protein n=1 Tax=Perkinsus chesapeaki TaxID=330153 RepID=A0A7J6ML85_PERCH|nr:hypothetical protein FOL47_000611 [Perkinsus chesapeaki]